jgi:hypothetical protein
MNKITITSKVHFQHGRRSQKQLQVGEIEPKPQGRVPRVAKLMALAIRFDKLVRDGVMADYAELARLGHVTRARITQIMNLLNLAPDIQEEILYLPQVTEGKDPITERELRGIVAEVDWSRQREMWK